MSKRHPLTKKNKLTLLFILLAIILYITFVSTATAILVFLMTSLITLIAVLLFKAQHYKRCLDRDRGKRVQISATSSLTNKPQQTPQPTQPAIILFIASAGAFIVMMLIFIAGNSSSSTQSHSYEAEVKRVIACMAEAEKLSGQLNELNAKQHCLFQERLRQGNHNIGRANRVLNCYLPTNNKYRSPLYIENDTLFYSIALPVIINKFEECVSHLCHSNVEQSCNPSFYRI